MKSSRAISILLLSAMLVGMAAGCGDTADNVPTNSSGTDTAAPESDLPKPDDTPDLPSDLRFDGQTFTFAVYENSAVHYSMLAEEQTGDTLNDAIYKRQIATEERFGITFEEGIYNNTDFRSMVRSSITAGDDAFDVANVRCTDALTYWQEGLLTSAEQLP
ncbi:MAG: hypothetical protein IJF67_17160, partial [Clostridia bacterium]|nr:hypothetical protein [Clostridia bacterium]